MARDDIRISVDLFDHPKSVKLIRRLGEKGFLAMLRLWTFAARHRSKGILHGMTFEDIAIAAQWDGMPDAFVSQLREIGWLDDVSGVVEIHDWKDHQPYAFFAEERSSRARNAAINRWKNKDKEKSCDPHATRMRLVRPSNAPAPDPSPAPDPAPDPIPNPKKEENLSRSSAVDDDRVIAVNKTRSSTPRNRRVTVAPEEFERFWVLYPRRMHKQTALRAYQAASKRPGFSLNDLLTATRHYAQERDGQDERFTKHPATFLNDDRWRDHISPPEKRSVNDVPRDCIGRPLVAQ